MNLNREYFFVRHGQSEANVSGLIASRVVGGKADPDLTDIGRAQVRASALAFLESQGGGNCAIVSSPFRRARKTAEIVAEVLGSDYSVDRRLRERDFGAFDGGCASSYDIVWANDARSLLSDEHQVEPVESVALRVADLIRDMETLGKGDRVLLVTHGDVGSIALAYFAAKPLNQHRAFGAMANAEFRKITVAKETRFHSAPITASTFDARVASVWPDGLCAKD